MTIADAAYWMGFTRDLLTALAIIAAAFLAVTLYARLHPRFMLRVLPEWVGNRLVLRFEIENTSLVYAMVERARVDVREKALEPRGWLAERVEFSDNADSRIFDSTDRIYPGEIPAVERVYDYPSDDVVVQVGFQVQLKKRWQWVFPEHQQTTTCIIVKPAREHAGN